MINGWGGWLMRSWSRCLLCGNSGKVIGTYVSIWELIRFVVLYAALIGWTGNRVQEGLLGSCQQWTGCVHWAHIDTKKHMAAHNPGFHLIGGKTSMQARCVPDCSMFITPLSISLVSVVCRGKAIRSIHCNMTTVSWMGNRTLSAVFNTYESATVSVTLCW